VAGTLGEVGLGQGGGAREAAASRRTAGAAEVRRAAGSARTSEGSQTGIAREMGEDTAGVLGEAETLVVPQGLAAAAVVRSVPQGRTENRVNGRDPCTPRR